MIDGHCHLNLVYKTAKVAVETLYQEATESGINKIILLNLAGPQFDDQLGFDNLDVLKHSLKYKDFFFTFPSINPSEPGALETLEEYKRRGAKGLKLHPRIHKYNVEDVACVELVKRAGELYMPVMICTFMDGINIKLGNTAQAYGRLADMVPNTKIALGHAGAHHIIDFMMIAKTNENIYLDLSFSLLYFGNSTIPKDIKYVIQSMRGKRIFWGTDYPDRPYQLTVDMSRAAFKHMELEYTALDNMLVFNVNEFLKNTDD
jgi:predicted TIM-barrel fold metal-dependent hydrolase